MGSGPSISAATLPAAPASGLDADMEQQFAGLYPSRFHRHEWEKCGTCSG
jgi:ribonuclease I